MTAAALGWLLWKSTNVRWANAQLPRIVAFADDRRYFEAYDLALAVDRYLPGEPTIAGLMPIMSDSVSASTDPPGARVYLTRFDGGSSGQTARQFVGTTPVANLRIARGEYILSMEKEGFAIVERTLSGTAVRVDNLTITPPPARLEKRLLPRLQGLHQRRRLREAGVLETLVRQGRTERLVGSGDQAARRSDGFSGSSRLVESERTRGKGRSPGYRGQLV